MRNYELLTNIERRQEHLNFLLRFCPIEIKHIPIKSDWVKWFYAHSEGHLIECRPNYEQKIKVYSLTNPNEEPLEADFYDRTNFKKEWNLREILETELVIEFDALPEIALKACYTTCINLINDKMHFVVFYAEGMRCPHIHLYDFLPLEELTPEQQKWVRLSYCNKVVDWADLRYLDRSLMETGHTISLEFSKHFRHGKMLKLMFEHVPHKPLNDTELYYLSRGIDAHAMSM